MLAASLQQPLSFTASRINSAPFVKCEPNTIPSQKPLTDHGVVSLRQCHHSLLHRRNHRPRRYISDVTQPFHTALLNSHNQDACELLVRRCHNYWQLYSRNYTHQKLTAVYSIPYSFTGREGMRCKHALHLASWRWAKRSQGFLPTFCHQWNWADIGYNKLIIMQNIFTTSVATRLARLWVSIAKTTKTFSDISTLGGTELSDSLRLQAIQYFADSQKSSFPLNTFWLTEASKILSTLLTHRISKTLNTLLNSHLSDSPKKDFSVCNFQFTEVWKFWACILLPTF